MTSAVVGYWICIGALLLALPLHTFLIVQVTSDTATVADVESTGQLIDGLDSVTGLINLLSAIFVAMWSYRVVANTHALGRWQFPWTPGWSAAYWFIPIVNLFRPYQVLRDLYLTSGDKAGVAPETATPVTIYWSSVLINLILMIAVTIGIAAFADPTSEQEALTAFLLTQGVLLVATVVTVVGLFFGIRAIRGVTERQELDATAA